MLLNPEAAFPTHGSFGVSSLLCGPALHLGQAFSQSLRVTLKTSGKPQASIRALSLQLKCQLSSGTS